METPSPKSFKPSKRLIVCCDGTWMSGDLATKRDNTFDSNVTRICRALSRNAILPDGTSIPQIIHYQSGVGSAPSTTSGDVIAALFGRGVNENILSAYSFLVNNYDPNDELFFFGFSRGGFTCRSLVAMISRFGILKREATSVWSTCIWDQYRSRLDDPIWGKNKYNVTHRAKIKLVGCWDTVGSLGVPVTRFTKTVTKLLNLNREHAFHDVSELPDVVEHAFHALALDETREAFSPTLWYIIPESIHSMQYTRLTQCWFAGVHTDVGRGYDDHIPGDTADITFAWMVDQCRGLLAFNEDMVSKMLEKGDFKEPVGARAERKRARREEEAKTWGVADIHTRRPTDPVDFLYNLCGLKTRTPGKYVFKAQGDARLKRRFITGLEPSKDIPKFDPVWTSEVIHPSVRMHVMYDPTYKPIALRGFRLSYDEARGRWTWIKTWTDMNGAARKMTMKEDLTEDSYFSMHKLAQKY